MLKTAIVIQCTTYNCIFFLFTEERKEMLPNPRAKEYLKEWSFELEGKTTKQDPGATELVHSAQHQTLLVPGKARAKGEGKLSPGFISTVYQ